RQEPMRSAPYRTSSPPGPSARNRLDEFAFASASRTVDNERISSRVTPVDGTLDRFRASKSAGRTRAATSPRSSVCTDMACEVRQNAKCVNKKHPRQYLGDQIFADSMVFSQEGIRHLGR